MKKILVISNNPLKSSDSNGRTLLNLLGEYDSENLIHIFISGGYDEKCSHSLCLPFSGTVKSYFKGSKVLSDSVFNKEENNEIVGAGGKVKKTPNKMRLRDYIYKHAKKQKKAVLAWVKQYSPDVILLQLSDSALLIDLAIYISEKLNIKIATYNTEDYYFKNYDYITQSFRMSLSYKRFHKNFVKTFDKLMVKNPLCIYNCDGLKKLYDEKFNSDGKVIYVSSDFTRDDSARKTLIAYTGNLGVGRDKTLIKLGEILNKSDKNAVIDVYGKTATEESEKALKDAKGINYHGLVSYEEVKKVINGSKLLISVESFDDYYKVDTAYAFSTKTADYMASGNPILLIAPKNSEIYNYLSNNNAAVISDGTDIEKAISDGLNNALLRKKVSKNAYEKYKENHLKEKNGKVFNEYIENL